MANQKLVLTFVLGFVLGIATFKIHSLAGADTGNVNKPPTSQIDHNGPIVQVNLDPFPLPPCNANRTSALYVFYGRSISLGGDELFSSINTLLESNFPGKVRVVIDQIASKTIPEEIDEKHRHLLKKIEFKVLPLPDLKDKELIPHSNKIRALQAGALIYGEDSDECTVSLDTDTFIHRHAPWPKLLSVLQLNDVAVAHDCNVPIKGVPDFLSEWMPNTGVLALRNTPRTRMVLRDWLDHYVPCNATHVSTCTPGTDQYSFLQLVVKHALRLHKLDTQWNCRVTPKEIAAGIDRYPMYAFTALTTHENPEAGGINISMTCGGHETCHILHGHWLKFP